MNSLSYFNPITLDGCIYSIDMVRLDLDFMYMGNQDIVSLITKNLTLNYEHYTSLSPHKYRDLLVVSCSNGNKFTLGVGFNALTGIERRKGFLEFNPNKCCGQLEFDNLFSYLKFYCTQMILKRWDLAIDIPYSRNRVKLHKDNRKYERHEHGAVTEYLGCRNSEGYLKVYDKTKESNLSYNITRIELTIDGNPNYDYVKDLFPQIDIYKNQYNMDMLLELSQNDLVLLKLLLSSSNYLDENVKG